MADVKWIKIVTNIFDDEKIRYIETLPNGDESIVIWFRILCLAGKSNSGGLLMMTDRIAYTEEMLSSIFQRDIKSIQLALNVFESLEMIERFDNKIYLTNWEKHQNTESLDKIREDTRKRVARYRDKQKRLDCNVTVTQDVTLRNDTEEEQEEEVEKEKNKYIGDFELFWSMYPKKVSKQDAYKRFIKVVKDQTTFDAIISDLEKRKGFEQWIKEKGKFIPNPSTYLNGQRWLDEYESKGEVDETNNGRYPLNLI